MNNKIYVIATPYTKELEKFLQKSLGDKTYGVSFNETYLGFNLKERVWFFRSPDRKTSTGVVFTKSPHIVKYVVELVLMGIEVSDEMLIQLIEGD